MAQVLVLCTQSHDTYSISLHAYIKCHTITRIKVAAPAPSCGHTIHFLKSTDDDRLVVKPLAETNSTDWAMLTEVESGLERKAECTHTHSLDHDNRRPPSAAARPRFCRLRLVVCFREVDFRVPNCHRYLHFFFIDELIFIQIRSAM